MLYSNQADIFCTCRNYVYFTGLSTVPKTPKEKKRRFQPFFKQMADRHPLPFFFAASLLLPAALLAAVTAITTLIALPLSLLLF